MSAMSLVLPHRRPEHVALTPFISAIFWLTQRREPRNARGRFRNSRSSCAYCTAHDAANVQCAPAFMAAQAIKLAARAAAQPVWRLARMLGQEVLRHAIRDPREVLSS